MKTIAYYLGFRDSDNEYHSNHVFSIPFLIINILLLTSGFYMMERTTNINTEPWSEVVEAEIIDKSSMEHEGSKRRVYTSNYLKIRWTDNDVIDAIKVCDKEFILTNVGDYNFYYREIPGNDRKFYSGIAIALLLAWCVGASVALVKHMP